MSIFDKYLAAIKEAKEAKTDATVIIGRIRVGPDGSGDTYINIISKSGTVQVDANQKARSLQGLTKEDAMDLIIAFQHIFDIDVRGISVMNRNMFRINQLGWSDNKEKDNE